MRSFLQVDALLPEELVGQEVHEFQVEVVAPQVGVAVGGFDFKDPFADLQDGDVEGAAAQVEDGDAFIFLFIQAVGHGGRGGFVDDPEHGEPGNGPGVFGGLALGVVEVGRHGDHRLGDLLAQVLLGGLLHLGEDHGRDFGGRIGAAPDLHVGVTVGGLDDLIGQDLDVPLHGRIAEFAADEALDGKHGI